MNTISLSEILEKIQKIPPKEKTVMAKKLEESILKEMKKENDSKRR